MRESVNKELCEEFGLHHGQFFAYYQVKNQWWSLDGGKTAFGYGDLRESDIRRIQQIIGDHVFTGWNEHHGSRWQQFNEAQIQITSSEVTHPYIEASNARRSAS